MDDGAGAFVSWRALSVVKQLGFKPKRTMRSVLWTAEEMGLLGATAYANVREPENQKSSVFVYIFERTGRLGMAISTLPSRLRLMEDRI